MDRNSRESEMEGGDETQFFNVDERVHNPRETEVDATNPRKDIPESLMSEDPTDIDGLETNTEDLASTISDVMTSADMIDGRFRANMKLLKKTKNVDECLQICKFFNETNHKSQLLESAKKLCKLGIKKPTEWIKIAKELKSFGFTNLSQNFAISVKKKVQKHFKIDNNIPILIVYMIHTLHEANLDKKFNLKAFWYDALNCGKYRETGERVHMIFGSLLNCICECFPKECQKAMDEDLIKSCVKWKSFSFGDIVENIEEHVADQERKHGLMYSFLELRISSAFSHFFFPALAATHPVPYGLLMEGCSLLPPMYSKKLFFKVLNTMKDEYISRKLTAFNLLLKIIGEYSKDDAKQFLSEFGEFLKKNEKFFSGCSEYPALCLSCLTRYEMVLRKVGLSDEDTDVAMKSLTEILIGGEESLHHYLEKHYWDDGLYKQLGRFKQRFWFLANQIQESELKDKFSNENFLKETKLLEQDITEEEYVIFENGIKSIKFNLEKLLQVASISEKFGWKKILKRAFDNVLRTEIKDSENDIFETISKQCNLLDVMQKTNVSNSEIEDLRKNLTRTVSQRLEHAEDHPIKSLMMIKNLLDGGQEDIVKAATETYFREKKGDWLVFSRKCAALRVVEKAGFLDSEIERLKKMLKEEFQSTLKSNCFECARNELQCLEKHWADLAKTAKESVFEIQWDENWSLRANKFDFLSWAKELNFPAHQIRTMKESIEKSIELINEEFEKSGFSYGNFLDLMYLARDCSSEERRDNDSFWRKIGLRCINICLKVLPRDDEHYCRETVHVLEDSYPTEYASEIDSIKRIYDPSSSFEPSQEEDPHLHDYPY